MTSDTANPIDWPDCLTRLKMDAAFVQQHVPDAMASLNSPPPSDTELQTLIDRLAPMPCGRPLVRIGGAADGGYLLPDDFDGITTCFSPGNNNFKYFEDDLYRRFGMRSYLCDYSSDYEKFSTPFINTHQFFEKKWLEPVSSTTAISLTDWVAKHGSDTGDWLLQMDIEGAEYRNLLATPQHILARFRIIALEVHSLHLSKLRPFFETVLKPLLNRLDDFVCVHANANNCCGETEFGPDLVLPNVLELTFYRRDRLQPHAADKPRLPHPLDSQNLPDRPPLFLRGRLLQHADTDASARWRAEQQLQWLLKQNARQTAELERIKAQLDLRLQIAQKVLGERNLALGKRAAQSSLSPYSKPNDAAGAINGAKTGLFGFHTAAQDQPWWRLDLLSIQRLNYVVIYNRLDACQNRAQSLEILVGEQEQALEVVYQHPLHQPIGGVVLYQGHGPLVVPMGGRSARYLKIRLRAHEALHLDQVEVYGFA